MSSVGESMDGGTDLEALTRGVHSTEALELVREHVLAVMGQTALAFSTAKVKLSKLQMAQVKISSLASPFAYLLPRSTRRLSCSATS